jgi:hypothetical protein
LPEPGALERGRTPRKAEPARDPSGSPLLRVPYHWLTHAWTRLCAGGGQWLALLLMLPALLPLAAPGYFFHAHDAPHSVFYLVEFDQALRSGAIWPVWAPDQAIGFGYPLWLVIAPLDYWAAELFHLLGLGFVVAVKATWAVYFIAGALGTYRLARRWWGPAAALVASVAYTYGPYHLVQIYVRADLGEFAALAVFPWVLLALAALWDDPRPRRLALAGTALGVLLLSHTVSQLLFVPVLAGFLALKLLAGLWAGRRRGDNPRSGTDGRGAKRLCTSGLYALAAGVLGLSLAAIFMLPAFIERNTLVQSQFVAGNYSYLKQFVYLNQFLSPLWGFGYAIEGPNDGMSLQLGILALLGAFIGTLAALRTRHDALPHRLEALFLAAVTILTIAAMTPASAVLWRALPLAGLIQFPWRLLTLTTITLALLAGAGTYWLEKQAAAAAANGLSPYVYIIALLFVAGSFAYTRPDIVPVRPQDEAPFSVIDFELRFPDMRGMTAWSERVPLDGDSPLLAQYKAGQPLQRAAIDGGQGTILDQGADAISAHARVQADGAVHLRFYTYYFPGWRATVDGRPVPIVPDPPNGLIGLTVPSGTHQVSIRFGVTPLRAVAGTISLAGLECAVALLTLDRKRVVGG